MPKRRLSDRGDEGRSDESSEDSLGRSEDRPNGKAVRHEGAPTQIKVERILGAKMLPFREKGLSVAWLDLQEQQGAEGQEPVEETTKEPYAPRSLYFLVKYEGFAHVNNEWVRKSHLHKLCELKLRNFMRKYGNPTDLRLDEPRWYRAEKLISRRPLTRVWSTLVEQPAWSSDRHTKDYQWLVKWSGLGYDSATWEDWSDQLEQILVNFENLRARWEKENRESKKRVECLLKRREAERSSGAGFLARARLVDKLMPLEEQPAWLCGGSLHPHQLEALNFLRLSYSRLENVVLADEMGLGKTISAISYVLALIHECSVMEPCLIVAPLSTIPNWEKELERWAPGVDAVTYHGNAEARRVIQEHEFDTGPGTRRARTIKPRVVLTTYEMIVSDTPVFRAVQWESLVVDEGHRLKNAQSKLSMRLNKLKIRHRVLLTGTPLQNNLTELFHLMAFVRPDLFPSLEDFQRQFSELKHEEQVESLKKRVAPHMLRRLKKDVMKDIPTRVERMVPVSLTSIQKAYYTAILTKNFKLLTHGTKGVPRLQNLVMQLRKVCNHPYLIPGTEPHHEMPKRRAELRINASGKLHLLDRMLTRLRKDGHRVLVFSQMTTMLDVLEDYIAHKFGQEAYERVDGSVPSSARQSRIARFNASGPEKFVFLLSTRACGLGLNLTSADTVVIFDSDWNPHNDIQAMSRAHRIGQKRQVVVYRLFCRGSVEERMLQLARKKMALDSMFLQSKNDSKHSAMVMEDIVRWGTEELFSSKEGSIGAKAEAGDGGECQGLRDLDEIGLEKLLDRSVPAGDPSRHDEAEDSREGLGAVLTDKAWELDEDIQQEAEHVIETADGFWEALLAERYEALEAEEHLELGKGKRTKKVVSYKEGGVRKPREEHEEQDWLDTAEAQVMIEENTHEDEELIHSQEEPQSDCLKEPPSTSATAERNTQHSTGVAVHEDQFLAPRSLEPKLANPILYGLTNEHGKNLSLSLAVIHIRFIGILKYELRTELRFQALAHQSMIVVAMILLVQPLEHRGKPVTKGVLAAILLLVATSGGRSPSSRLIGSLSTTLGVSVRVLKMSTILVMREVSRFFEAYAKIAEGEPRCSQVDRALFDCLCASKVAVAQKMEEDPHCFLHAVTQSDKHAKRSYDDSLARLTNQVQDTVCAIQVVDNAYARAKTAAEAHRQKQIADVEGAFQRTMAELESRRHVELGKLQCRLRAFDKERKILTAQAEASGLRAGLGGMVVRHPIVQRPPTTLQSQTLPLSRPQFPQPRLQQVQRSQQDRENRQQQQQVHPPAHYQNMRHQEQLESTHQQRGHGQLRGAVGAHGTAQHQTLGTMSPIYQEMRDWPVIPSQPAMPQSVLPGRQDMGGQRASDTVNGYYLPASVACATPPIGAPVPAQQRGPRIVTVELDQD